MRGDWNAEEAFAIGDFLDETLPADCLVATEWAGIIPSRMRQPILDIFGLNDKDIITRDDFQVSNMGRGITAKCLVSRAPEVAIVVARIFPTVETARQGIDNRPDGTWVKRFYASLRTPESGHQLCIMKIGEVPVLTMMCSAVVFA